MRPHLVDEVRDAKPPRQRAQDDGQVAQYGFADQSSVACKGKAGEQAYEQKDDERIGKGDEEGCHKVMQIGPFLARRRPEGLHRVAAESVYAEGEQHDAAYQLQVEDVFIHIVEYKTHAVACEQRIADVAHGCTHPRHESIPPAFVQCTLDAEYTHGTQRCRHDDADDESFPQDVNYGLNLNHGCKYRISLGKFKEMPPIALPERDIALSLQKIAHAFPLQWQCFCWAEGWQCFFVYI